MKHNLNDEVWFYDGEPNGYDTHGTIVHTFEYENEPHHVIKVTDEVGDYLVIRAEVELS